MPPPVSQSEQTMALARRVPATVIATYPANYASQPLKYRTYRYLFRVIRRKIHEHSLTRIIGTLYRYCFGTQKQRGACRGPVLKTSDGKTTDATKSRRGPVSRTPTNGISDPSCPFLSSHASAALISQTSSRILPWMLSSAVITPQLRESLLPVVKSMGLPSKSVTLPAPDSA